MIEMCQTIHDETALKSKKVAGKYLKQKSNFSNQTTFIFKDLKGFKATACIELMEETGTNDWKLCSNSGQNMPL
jgi:hypothetical protein